MGPIFTLWNRAMTAANSAASRRFPLGRARSRSPRLRPGSSASASLPKRGRPHQRRLTAGCSGSARGPRRNPDRRAFLHTSATVNRFQEKAGFDAASGLYALATLPFRRRCRTQSDVIDLTSRMRADGTLDWTPPSGRWVVSGSAIPSPEPGIPRLSGSDRTGGGQAQPGSRQGVF